MEALLFIQPTYDILLHTHERNRFTLRCASTSAAIYEMKLDCD
jgi:hypothetical protein